MPMCLSTNWENDLRPEAWQRRVGDDGPVFTEVNRKKREREADNKFVG